jgi:hypothetical protein
MANEIHAAIWDYVGLGKVQGFVREWASNWVALVNAAEAKRQEKFAFARQALHYPDDRTLNLIADNLPDDWQLKEALWDPKLPELPLPPSHRPRSPAEKWAALAAVHDVFDLTGEKVLPWPLPEDNQDLAAYTEWMRGEGGSYLVLMRAASALTDTEADPVGRWVEDVKPAIGEYLSLRGQEVAAATAAGTVPQYVTIDQAASLVKRHKDTLYRWLRADSIAPLPIVEGGGGKRHEYLWSALRPWLETKSGRELPERFPDLGPG